MTALKFTCGALLLSCSQHAAAQELSSFIFDDNISSRGIGNIDLFAPKTRDRIVTGELLELFRQDNGGSLVFAVDVNENAAGSETADSQGVAIESASLRIVVDGQERVFSGYATRTRSLLTAAGAPTPSEYFTLIGTAGSNRISPDPDSELTGSSLDETLYFTVDLDLNGASAATLDIVLLNTDAALGDPEAFYDFSNGFEEVALLTRVDVDYLESLASGRAGAPLVISDDAVPALNWSYFPSAQSYYVAAYEDLYPQRGDYDFNDLVVGYQVALGTNAQGEVAELRGNGYLVARGAEYDHDWHLAIDLPSWASGKANQSLYAAGSHSPLPGYPLTSNVAGPLNLKLTPNVAQIFADGASTYVNTFADQALVRGPRFEFDVTLDQPIPLAEVASAPFDPFLYVHDTGYEIHLVNQPARLPYSRNSASDGSEFRDNLGYPFALILPESWVPPLAAVDMGLAYPDFVRHVESNGANNQQWYLNRSSDRVKNIPLDHWKW